jgi:MoaA/NifB/PqqE/SkfB family radical SAM enzyme
MKTHKASFRNKILKKLLLNLPKASDKNLINLTRLVEFHFPPEHRPKIQAVRKIFQEKHPALKLARRFISGLDKNCQEKFLDNLILNGFSQRQKKREKLLTSDQAPLFTVLISPTMRCNLRCQGCYAQNYKKEDDLPYEVIDRVINEAKNEMSTAFFTILGGEPFIRKDIFDIFQKHSDVYFQVYTNGTLIDKKIAQRLAKLGNVWPQISIEGFECHTDERRGQGTFEKVMKAMDILREAKIPFGYSVCVTRHNIEEVVSDEFVDLMIDKGALMGWYFLYMPVCGDKNIKLMPTPEQRNYLRKRRAYIRSNKPLFIIDFWNDAPYVGGCIAAKDYIHINNYGDVEPCIFTHFAQANVKNTPLKEAVNCQFFQEIRKRQPYDENLLMPCMLIDHPNVSRQLCQECKVYPTHPGALALFKDLKDDLNKYSQEVHQLFDNIWQKEYQNSRSED